MTNATIENQTAPATQTIWVLSYALPEGNTVRPASSPDIFTTEAEAVAAFDKAMREEWPSNAPCDDEGESLPYPGDPWKAHEAIVDDKAKGDVDEPWGEWNLSSHTIPLPAPMPAAPSPDAMAVTIVETECGEPIDGGKKLPIHVQFDDIAIWISLSGKAEPGIPIVAIELQAQGWTVYIHDGERDDPSHTIVLPVAKA